MKQFVHQLSQNVCCYNPASVNYNQIVLVARNASSVLITCTANAAPALTCVPNPTSPSTNYPENHMLRTWMRTVRLYFKLWRIRTIVKVVGPSSPSPSTSTCRLSCPSTRRSSRWRRKMSTRLLRWITRWRWTAASPTWLNVCLGTSARPPATAWEQRAIGGFMMAAASALGISASTTALTRAGALSVH